MLRVALSLMRCTGCGLYQGVSAAASLAVGLDRWQAGEPLREAAAIVFLSDVDEGGAYGGLWQWETDHGQGEALARLASVVDALGARLAAGERQPDLRRPVAGTDVARHRAPMVNNGQASFAPAKQYGNGRLSCRIRCLIRQANH